MCVSVCNHSSPLCSVRITFKVDDLSKYAEQGKGRKFPNPLRQKGWPNQPNNTDYDQGNVTLRLLNTKKPK